MKITIKNPAEYCVINHWASLKPEFSGFGEILFKSAEGETSGVCFINPQQRHIDQCERMLAKIKHLRETAVPLTDFMCGNATPTTFAPSQTAFIEQIGGGKGRHLIISYKFLSNLATAEALIKIYQQLLIKAFAANEQIDIDGSAMWTFTDELENNMYPDRIDFTPIDQCAFILKGQ